MKQFFCAALTLLLLCPLTAAQKTDSDLVDKQVVYLTEHLQLTTDQALQAKDILTGALQLTAINREKYKDDPDGMAEAVINQRQIRDAQLEEILYDNQKEKLTEVLSALPGAEEAVPPDSEPRQNPRLAELTERLKLSDDQVEKIGALFALQEKEMKAAREQMQNHPGGRSQGPDRRDDMKDKMEEFQEKIKALLTEEQKVEYARYLEERLKERKSRRPPDSGGQPGW